MYCIDTKVLAFMFNGGSPYGFTIHPIFTNHINNEKHVHHGFLAPRPYLCSTSLNDGVNVITLIILNTNVIKVILCTSAC